MVKLLKPLHTQSHNDGNLVSHPMPPAAPALKGALDWKKLVALGVADHDAKAICMKLHMRNVVQHYCKLLVQNGVPSQDVKCVAEAIARFDIKRRYPTEEQRTKLYEYALPLCRANLWRTGMFES